MVFAASRMKPTSNHSIPAGNVEKFPRRICTGSMKPNGLASASNQQEDAAAASSSRASNATTPMRQDIKQVKATANDFSGDDKRATERARNTRVSHKQQPSPHEKMGVHALLTAPKTTQLKPSHQQQQLSIPHQKLGHPTPHPDNLYAAAEKMPIQDSVIEPHLAHLVENKRNHPSSSNSSSNVPYSLCVKWIPGILFLLCAVISVGTVCGSGRFRDRQPDFNNSPVHQSAILNRNVRYYEDKRMEYANEAPNAMQRLPVPHEKVFDRPRRRDKSPSDALEVIPVRGEDRHDTLIEASLVEDKRNHPRNNSNNRSNEPYSRIVKCIPGVFLLLGAAVLSVGIMCGSGLCKEHQPHFHNVPVHHYEGARLANANDILVVPKRNLTDNTMLPFDISMMKDMDTNDVTYFLTVSDDGIIVLN